MKSKIIIAILLSITSQFVLALDNTLEIMAKRIVILSGMEETLSSIPKQIIARAEEKIATSNRPEYVRKVVNAMVSSFSNEESIRIVSNYILKHVTKNEMKNIIMWLDSPLGKRINEVELEAASVEGQANLVKYVESLESNPPAQSRIDLIMHYESASRLTEVTISALEAMTSGMMKITNEIAPDDEKMSTDEINLQVKEAFANEEQRQMLFQQIIVMSFYSYRNVSDEQLIKYIQFLSSEAGIKYIDMINGIAQVFTNIFEPTIKILAEEQTKI